MPAQHSLRKRLASLPRGELGPAAGPLHGEAKRADPYIACTLQWLHIQGLSGGGLSGGSGRCRCMPPHACLHAWREDAAQCMAYCMCMQACRPELSGLIKACMRRAVEGITIYISDFKRSLADKLSKDFFTEPSQVGGYHVIRIPQTAVQPERGLCSLGCQSMMTWP